MENPRHWNYDPWHIVTVNDETADQRFDVQHPKTCNPADQHCSTASFIGDHGFDDDENIPAPGTYRVRYWWDHYEPDGDGVEVEACGPGSYHSDCGRFAADCDCQVVAVLDDVRTERMRQIAKWGEQHREDGTGGGATGLGAEQAKRVCQRAEANGGASWNQVLSEEYFEAIAETDPAKLRAELVQVAAVACAWIEDIDSRTAGAR